MTRIINTPTESRSFEDNFRHEFGPVTFSPFFSFCENNNIFEVLTSDYISKLAEYLTIRLDGLSPKLCERLILEVGTGDGRLAHFLSQRNLPTLIATDNGSWTLEKPFEVLDMSHETAVENFQPAIMICSWMPENTDFTSAWRSAATVKEYLLIGSMDSELSGLPWETWGFVSPYLPDGLSLQELASMDDQDPKKRTMLSPQAAYEATERGEDPPYRAESSERVRIGTSRFQISRRESSPSFCAHSKTVSFRRTTKV